MQTMTHTNEQIIAYLQGKLTPQERATLLEEAQHDEALRTAIMAQMEANALLLLHESQTNMEEGERQLRAFKTRLRRKRWLHAAKQSWRYAAVLLIGMLTMWFFLPKPAPTKPTLSMQTLHVPYGQHCQMTLPDGSKVWLNANTILRFATPFVSERRLFLQGEALFEVAKNKQLPFVVTANGVNVEALGTRFHVKNYAGAPLCVSLLRGSVQVYRPEAPQKGVILLPHQSVVATNTGFERIAFNDQISTWQSGILSFQSASLAAIVQELQQYYGVKISIKNRNILQTRYSGRFRTSDGAAEILRVLSCMQGFKMSENKRNNEIIIR